jgi:hypothetical protein
VLVYSEPPLVTGLILLMCFVDELYRPLPLCLRSHMWFATLNLEKRIIDSATESIFLNTNINSNFSRLAPSLDVLYSRRCHVLLDLHYPSISSRVNAATIKTIIINFMKKYQLSMNFKEETIENETVIVSKATANKSFVEADHIFFVLVPLVVSCLPELLELNTVEKSNPATVTIGSSSVYAKYLALASKKISNSPAESEEIVVAPAVVPSPADRLAATPDVTGSLTTTTTAAASPSSQSRFKSRVISNDTVQLSVVMRTTLESVMDIDKLGVISAAGVFSLHSPLLDRCLAHMKAKDPDMVLWLQGLPDLSYAPADEVEGAGGGRHMSSTSQIFYTFDSFVDTQLMRGLSGLLSLETTLFVWDQCFIAGFYSMLPIVLTALVLGCKQEMAGLSSLNNALDTFCSYCSNVTTLRLQRLCTEHCNNDLKNIFCAQGTYRLSVDNEGVLQALYKEIVPSEVDQLAGRAPAAPVPNPVPSGSASS